MVLQSEYFDPTTGIIHIAQEELVPLAAGATDSRTLGLEDTAFDDVKCKLLSVDYRIKLYTAESGDTTLKQFSTSYHDYGMVIFGIGNKTENFDLYTSLGAFQGTSSFPVHWQGYSNEVGLPASITKSWKPRKMGLSNEQNAFMSFRSEPVSSGSLVSTSIYMRLIRL
jgi:hypothetical protein